MNKKKRFKKPIISAGDFFENNTCHRRELISEWKMFSIFNLTHIKLLTHEMQALDKYFIFSFQRNHKSWLINTI